MIAEKPQFLSQKFGNTSSKIYRSRKLAKQLQQLFNLLNMFCEKCIKTANTNGWKGIFLIDFQKKEKLLTAPPPPSKKYTNLERLLLATISKGKRKRLEDSLVVLPFVRILASKKEGRAISLLGHIEKKLVLSQSNLADLEPTNK